MASNDLIQNNTNASLFEYISKLPFPIGRAEDPSTKDTGNAENATWRGRLYEYSPGYTGSTTNNMTAFRDANGRVFVASADAAILYPRSFIEQRTAPPSNPNTGNTYLVGAGASGAFAGRSNLLAVYTLWDDWDFIDVPVGWSALETDSDTYWRRKSDGTWELGLGTSSLGTNSVRPGQLRNPDYLIVQGTINDPATVSPQTGDMYIVGSNPVSPLTANFANRLVEYVNGRWGPVPPGNRRGQTVRDISNGTTRTWDGTEWTLEGVDNPLVYYQFTNLSPNDVTPAGQQNDNQSREFFRYTIPSNVDVLEVDYSDFSMNLTAYLNRGSTSGALFYGSLKLRLGNTDVRTFNMPLASATRIWLPGQDRTFQINNITLQPELIPMASFSSRILTLVLDAGALGAYEVTQGRAPIYIRNINTLTGEISIKGLRSQE